MPKACTHPPSPSLSKCCLLWVGLSTLAPPNLVAPTCLETERLSSSSIGHIVRHLVPYLCIPDCPHGCITVSDLCTRQQ